ncbi:MAG: glutamate 5-kinase, partial [Candidatus Omnitrophica bacterium]|nr:glutamate 5-kinase [Candidatus Omnitrophota bacterium]
MSDQRQTVSRLVVKVGASVLTDATGKPQISRLRQLVEQVAVCVAQHREIVMVSSGAIACGMARLALRRRPKDIAQLQACAAIGQGELMRLYSEAFAAHRLTVAQVLLTQADVSDQVRYRNARNTLQALLARTVVPIVNENDAVSVEEIAFGDNDRLAALVAQVIQAQLLVILTDVDGLLQDGRVIERVDRLTNHHEALALGASRDTTTGGMASKLAAARITRHSGIPLVIANGKTPGILQELLQGKPVGTLIAPPARALKFRKWWIAFSVRRPLGTVVIDDGAVEALLHRGRSLLASGIHEVHGRFVPGDPIAVVDKTQREVARGLSNFSS